MSLARPREDAPLRAIAIMAITVGVFTMIDTSAKWLILAGLPPLQVVCARYTGHFLTSLFVFLPREGRLAFRSNWPRLQLLRSLALLASTVFNFAALKYLPLTVTTAVFFAGPIVVSLMSIPILGETIGLRRFVAVIVGFLGVLVIVHPGGEGFHWAILFSIGGLLCASLYFVLTRLLAGIEGNATSQLWSSGIATLVLIPIAWSVWVWPETVMGYVMLGLIGVFGASAHILVTTAHRLADASTLAPVVYLQVIYATLAGWLVFATLPSGNTVLGTAIIAASGIYIWQRERSLAKAARRAAP